MNFLISLIAFFSAQAQALSTDCITSMLSNRTVMLIVGLLFVAAALVMLMQGCKCCSLGGSTKHRHGRKKMSSKSPVRSASKSSANTSTSSLRRSPRKSKATF